MPTSEHTVNRENFLVKNIFVGRINYENKTYEIFHNMCMPSCELYAGRAQELAAAEILSVWSCFY